MRTFHQNIYNFYIVDPDRNNGQFIENAIRTLFPKAKVNCFSAGIDALKSLYESQTKPDMILIDLEKNESVAKEALALIKQNEFFYPIPVYTLGNSHHRKERTVFSEIGANGFCLKPTSMSGMKNVIKKISDSFSRSRS